MEISERQQAVWQAPEGQIFSKRNCLAKFGVGASGVKLTSVSLQLSYGKVGGDSVGEEGGRLEAACRALKESLERCGAAAIGR